MPTIHYLVCIEGMFLMSNSIYNYSPQKFKQKCIELFGEEDGSIVWTVIRDIKFDLKSDKQVNITTRRIKMIEDLAKYGKQNILDAIDIWLDGISCGRLSSKQHGIGYFRSIVINPIKTNNKTNTCFNKAMSAKEKKKLENTINKITKKKEVPQEDNEKTITPIQLEKVYTDRDEEYKNYAYKCTCENPVRITQDYCSRCRSKLNWESYR